MASCTWDVYVDFGDGTSEDYVFDGMVGLDRLAPLPDPGVTYTVHVNLSNGHSEEPGIICFDYATSSQVRYRTAAEEVDPPEEEAAPPEETEGDGDGAPGGGGQESAGPAPTAAAGVGRPGAAHGAGARSAVEALLEALRRLAPDPPGRLPQGPARRAAARAGELSAPGSARVGGFSCRLRAGRARPIVCRRGRRGILAGS